MRRLLMALVALLLATPLGAQDLAEVSLPDPRQEAEAVALMDTIRCVVCQGQPISGSNAGLAADMRRIIRERIAAGETPEQVRAWLVERYGDWVSLQPRASTTTAPLWLLPLLALAGGAWIASRRLRRRAR
ncbi:MAG: cytochrome c-type biogenesis protein CcmH [Porphyrobacter sp.]|nr:cytochrome c-type biogenesis protein CcmH [Porphyrobacter sp.]